MVNDWKNKQLKVVAITTVLLVLLFIGIYLWAINGVPYAHSLTYIRDNQQIREALGTIENQHLAYLGKYYVRTNGSEGHADFKIIVQGTKDSGNLFLILRQREGNWNVVDGKLEYGGNRTLVLVPES